MYELLVLSLLMHFPLHAYLITKIISPWESISKGTLSTLLIKLEKAELIREADYNNVPFPSERQSRTFQITEKGRKHFFELMLETTQNFNTYQKIFHIKSMHMEFLAKDDQLYLVNHYLKLCEKSIRELEDQIEKFENNPEPEGRLPSELFYSTTQDLLSVRLEQIQLDYAWAERLRERIRMQE